MIAQLRVATRCSHGSVSRARHNAALPETTGRRSVATVANEIFVP
jgi:hypothetical protein